MPQNLNTAQEYAQKWLEIIKNPERPPEDVGKWIIEESMRNFGAPEDRIEEQVAGMRSSMGDNFTPLGQVKNYFTGLIWNAVLVLITSLVVRKSEPVEM